MRDLFGQTLKIFSGVSIFSVIIITYYKYESLPGRIFKNIEFDMKGVWFSVCFLPERGVSRTS